MRLLVAVGVAAFAAIATHYQATAYDTSKSGKVSLDSRSCEKFCAALYKGVTNSTEKANKIKKCGEKNGDCSICGPKAGWYERDVCNPGKPNAKCCEKNTPTCCNGTCVDTESDKNHCGRCGKKCSNGQDCKWGECYCPSNRKCGKNCCPAGKKCLDKYKGTCEGATPACNTTNCKSSDNKECKNGKCECKSGFTVKCSAQCCKSNQECTSDGKCKDKTPACNTTNCKASENKECKSGKCQCKSGFKTCSTNCCGPDQDCGTDGKCKAKPPTCSTTNCKASENKECKNDQCQCKSGFKTCSTNCCGPDQDCGTDGKCKAKPPTCSTTNCKASDNKECKDDKCECKPGFTVKCSAQCCKEGQECTSDGKCKDKTPACNTTNCDESKGMYCVNDTCQCGKEGKPWKLCGDVCCNTSSYACVPGVMGGKDKCTHCTGPAAPRNCGKQCCPGSSGCKDGFCDTTKHLEDLEVDGLDTDRDILDVLDILDMIDSA